MQEAQRQHLSVSGWNLDVDHQTGSQQPTAAGVAVNKQPSGSSGDRYHQRPMTPDVFNMWTLHRLVLFSDVSWTDDKHTCSLRSAIIVQLYILLHYTNFSRVAVRSPREPPFSLPRPILKCKLNWPLTDVHKYKSLYSFLFFLPLFIYFQIVSYLYGGKIIQFVTFLICY